MKAGLLLALLGAPLGAPLGSEPQQEGQEEDALEIAEPEAPEPPLAEGALQNDVFLPVSPPAAELLARGDAGLDIARELAGGDRERARTTAFEDWLAALEGAEEGAVPADPDLPAAFTEGIWYALLRRLGALAPEERAAWRARFEPPAAAALQGAWSRRAGLAAGLAAVERSFPGTRAAWVATLASVDVALEGGQHERARALLERARALAALCDSPDSPDAEQALHARDALLPPREAPASAAWETADELVLVGSLELQDSEQEPADERRLLAQHGVRPGLAWLDERRLAVQTAGRVHLIELSADGPRLTGTFAPLDLLGQELGAREAPHAGRQAPGWGLSPAAAASAGGADRLVLVVGRAIASEGEQEEAEPNALVCVALEQQGARLLWAVSGSSRLGRDGSRVEDPALATDAGPEFQPAPRIAGSLVLASAREIGAEERAWLYAFDLETGELAWRRFLAQGADLSQGGGRFGGGPPPRLASPAPLVLGSRVFAATTLGAGALLDLADGRPCWSLAIRRRSAHEPGWSGSGPFAIGGDPPGAFGGDPPGLLWDPVDSDVLYRLRAAPLATLAPGRTGTPARTDVFLDPPRRIDEAEDLVGGDPGQTLVFAHTGQLRGLSQWGAAGTDPLHALALGADERFRGSGLVGARRIYACTERGVYLFDRERDLYLLQHAALPPGRGVPALVGGDLHARGEHVVVLGRDRLWVFRAR